MQKKVLVCITPQSNSKRLIDKGYEVCSDNSELHILHVEKGNNVLENQESFLLIQQLFTYASELGGIVHGICGEDIYNTIKNFILDEVITNVVIGSPVEGTSNDLSITDKLKKDLPYLKISVLERNGY